MLSETYGIELKTKLGLPMCALDKEQSQFFKRHYNADKYNIGPLVNFSEHLDKGNSCIYSYRQVWMLYVFIQTIKDCPEVGVILKREVSKLTIDPAGHCSQKW